jgi:predicted extracellular nuclease
VEGAGLKNLATDIPDSERYSVIDVGNSQARDYIMVSSVFCPISYGEYVHVNAEFVEQVSSHDPKIACIQVGHL